MGIPAETLSHVRGEGVCVRRGLILKAGVERNHGDINSKPKVGMIASLPSAAFLCRDGIAQALSGNVPQAKVSTISSLPFQDKRSSKVGTDFSLPFLAHFSPFAQLAVQGSDDTGLTTEFLLRQKSLMTRMTLPHGMNRREMQTWKMHQTEIRQAGMEMGIRDLSTFYIENLENGLSRNKRITNTYALQSQ